MHDSYPHRPNLVAQLLNYQSVALSFISTHVGKVGYNLEYIRSLLGKTSISWRKQAHSGLARDLLAYPVVSLAMEIGGERGRPAAV